MNRSGRYRLSRRCGGVFTLLALGICLLTTAKQATAGCIHPSLILRGSGTSGSAYFELLPETGAMAAGVVDLTAPPTPKKSPCPGGVCSKAPVTPLTFPTTIAPGVDDLAALERTPITIAPGGSLLMLDGPLDAPDAPALSIFHPPRLFPFA